MNRENRIKSYLELIGGTDDVETIAAGSAPGVQRNDGPESGRSLAAEAIRKLARSRPLSADEQFNVEAIIIPDLRPAVRIHNSTYKIDHHAWMHLNEEATKSVISKAIPSVGRVELPEHPSLPYGGTGFVVGDNLLMTNRHVAEIFAAGLGNKGLSFIPGRRAGVDFRREDEDDAPDYLDVRAVVLIHPYWDMALLSVEGLSPHRRPIPLSLVHMDDLRGRDIVAVGYPAFDPRNSASVQQKVFGGIYNVKRLQPGIVRSGRSINSFEHDVLAMTHDSSTLGGNSGTGIIDPETGHVVGLHFGGRYLDANFAVSSYDLSRDKRVVDAGVVFAGTPSTGASATDRAWKELEEATQRSFRRDGAAGAEPVARVSLEIPIRISIEAGQAVRVDAVGAPNAPDQVAAAAGRSRAGTEAMVEPYHERVYTKRSGYDANFLGIHIPLPKAKNDLLVARADNGEVELRYHHFSIVMHADRRLALVTGANVNANPSEKRPEPRPAKDYTRDGLGGLRENDRERWFTDPRVAPQRQLPDRFFERDRKAFDKGHLVRREDVSWGRSYEEVRAANGDTFHVTNCSPQVAGFNRARETNWGALENLILEQAATERLCVFSAPVLSDNDELFTGVDEDGQVQVQIPSKFWKVVSAVANGRVRSFGFLLEQDLRAVPWEFVVPDAWVSKTVSIREIEDLAGIVFPEVVRESDQKGQSDEGLLTATHPSSPALSSLVDDLAPILEGWRNQQSVKQVENTVRFTLNFAGSPPGDGTTRKRISDAFKLEVGVSPLFEGEDDLQLFRLVTIPNVDRIDRPDMFDLARALREITGAKSVDPDLGSDYYGADPPPDHEAEAGPESGNLAFWCWASDKKDAPIDRDWAVTTTNVPDAWQRSVDAGKPSKGKGIRIFQPDTGVVANHGELGDSLHKHLDAANFVEPGMPPLDTMKDGSNPGHGTGTASVVVSAIEGTMRGVAPEATLVPVRCITSVAVFDQSPVAQAIDHARRKGADVITMSLGGVFSEALRAAVQKAVAANVIVLAAAGNCVGEVVWPARYEETIAVGGINEASRPWRGSSRGPSVAISGPAEFVLRADARDAANPNAVSGGQGTSFATAHLAGVAALWLAHHGRDNLISLLPAGSTLQEMFRAVIRRTARVPNGFDTQRYGAGIVNAGAVLQADPAAALKEAAGARKSGMLDQLTSLLDRVFGGGSAEAAGAALRDPQNYPELAAAAFEMLRAGRSPVAKTEAMPPIGLSTGLRAALGARAAHFVTVSADRGF